MNGGRVLHRDFETRSRVNLEKVGAHRYAANMSTEILARHSPSTTVPCSYGARAIPIRQEFFEAAANPTWAVAAHNDAFESAIEQYVLRPPRLADDSARASSLHQAMCLAVGLPARLSAAADALELQNRKDAAGERLMYQMAKPRRARKDEDPTGIYWFDDQERLHGSIATAGKTSK